MKPRAFPISVCALAWASVLAVACPLAEGSPVSRDVVSRANRRRMPDAWDLTRKAAAVVAGTTSGDGGQVTLTVSRTLKGQGLPQRLTLPAEHFPDFHAKTDWLVFLDRQATDYQVLWAESDKRAEAEQAVAAVLELDALPNDEAKCRRLVELSASYMSLVPSCAFRELKRYNRAEFIDLLEPLTQHAGFTAPCLMLLNNPSPKALGMALGPLKLSRAKVVGYQDEMLEFFVGAFRDIQPGNQALSAELAKYMGHWHAQVRSGIIWVLKTRGYREAAPLVFTHLDDPHEEVRVAAVAWPWWSFPDYRQRVMPKVRALARNDPDDRVRGAACECLVDMRDTPSFYFLWATSLFGNNGTIRGAIHLDLLWEDSPVVISLILLWPTLLLAAVVGAVQWRFHARRLLLAAGIGLVCAYAVGAAGGFLLGKYYTSNPTFSATILIPPLVLPLGILTGVLVWVMVRRAAARG